MGATPPTNYKMSDVVNKLLSPSLTSYYHIDVALPSNGNLKKFLEFRLPVDSALFERISLSCSEASLPGSSIATHEVNNDYPGVSEKMAYRRLYDDRIDFTFYVDHDYKIINFFERWISYCVGEDLQSFLDERNYFYRVNFPNDYQTDSLYITKFERDYTNALEYKFVRAYPISITSMPISYDSSQLLKCTVSFTYTRYIIETFALTNPSGEPASNQNNPNTNQLSPGNPDISKFGPAFGSNEEAYRQAAILRGETVDGAYGDTTLPSLVR